MAYYRKHYGPLALPYLRLIVRLRAFEEWLRIGKMQPDKALRKQARRDVRAHMQEILVR